MISFTVSLPPSANNLFLNVPRRGRVKAPEYRAWIEENGWLIKIARGSGMIDGPYGLVVKVGKPDRRKRDLDGVLKPVSDLIVSMGAVKDDSLCQRIEASWTDQHEGVFCLILPTQAVPVAPRRAA